jgi:hypothetical protein
LFIAGCAAAGLVALMVGLGPTKSVAVAFGTMLALAMFEWPIIGLTMVVLSATCFQIMGSETITGLPLSLSKIFGSMTLAIWLFTSIRDRTPWTYSPQLLALLAYVGAMGIVGILVHPEDPSPENGFTRFLQVAAVFWLAANLGGTDRKSLLIYCASLTAGLALCGVIGTLEHFVPSLAIESDDPQLTTGAIGAVIDHDSLEGIDLRRITGGLGDSNWLADTIVAVLPLNLFWLWRARGFLTRVLVVAIAGLQFLALVLSYTRAGFIGLAVALVYLVWRRILSIRLLAWAGVAAVALGLVWLPPGFVDRIFSIKYLEEGSTPMRKDLTGSALKFALERPVLGYGYGQFGVQFIDRLNTDLSNRVGAWGFELARSIEEGRELVQNIGAHNLYLEVAVEYGLLGLIPFACFMGLALYDLHVAERWGTAEDRILAICIAAGLIGFYVCGMFVHAKYLKILWFMAGLAAAHRRVVLSELEARVSKMVVSPRRALPGRQPKIPEPLPGPEPIRS